MFYVCRQLQALPALRPLVLAVKAFLRQRGLNEVHSPSFRGVQECPEASFDRAWLARETGIKFAIMHTLCCSTPQRPANAFCTGLSVLFGQIPMPLLEVLALYALLPGRVIWGAINITRFLLLIK